MEPKRNYIKARASLMPLLVQSVALMLFSNITTAQTTTINTQTLATSGYSSATSAGSGGTAFITFCIYNNTGGNIKMTEVGRYVTTSHNGVESTIYYSSTSLSGAVGSLPATGWTQIHKDTIAGVSASAIAKVNDNVNFTIPNGATYRFALLIGGTNYYSSSGSPNSFTVNNISLYAGNYQISGSNVGYGATNTPRYFRGYVTFEPSCPASITTQPKDSTLCAGGNAGFGITATNVNTYQWQLSTNGGTSWNNISNGGAYSGATTNTLSVTGTTTAMNNYKYRCAATNTAGSCTVPSEAATLIVNAVPAITSTTADTACTGTPAQLAAVATAGATVQWYNQATGGTLLGTGNTLNIPSAPATNTNYYAFPNVTSVLSPDTLSVQMGATNSQTGCFMDIKALANIKLTDISWIPTATQSYDVSIYFKTGTAIGSETNSSSWTQIGSASSVSATSGVPIKTTLSTQPNLSANTTYAILVIRTGSSGSVRYQTVSAVGSVEAQNSDLQLISAKGISGLFTGSLFSPRQLACIVWYQKEVTPPCTATTRTPVQLVVDATPAIILHPKDSTICENGTGAFISAASNASSYQWEVSTDGGTNWNNVSNGSIYSGATTPSLIITGGTVAMSGYKYRCKASCTSSVTSNTATLTIITTPAITTNPLDATICDGGNTSFICAATGTGQLSYQWQISTDGGTNWTNVIDGGIYSGSSTATLNITGATVSTSGYRFRCIVSGTCAPDAMSNEAILTVNSLPAVTTNPTSEADCPGTNVTFNCAATGTSTSYQWQEFTTTWSNLSNGGGYSGTSSNTLSISNISPAQDGRLYRCVISGACSPADTTDTASLTVYPTPNVSGTSNSPVCEEDNLQLTGASTTSGVTFSWTGPNGFSSGIQSPAIASPVVAHTGNFVVTTTVTATGCTAQATVPVVVKLKPSIPALTSNSAVCTNYDIELTASSTTGSTYSWTGPNNFNSNQQNPKRTKATNQMEGYYTAVATLNGCPSEPDSIFVDIVPSPAIGAYPSPGNKVCTGETITFFGISSNTGTNPVYQWLRNNVPIPGADYLKYISSGLIAGDVIKLRMTPGNDVSCNDDIFSVDIPVTVLPFLAPSVSISMDPPDNIWPGLLVTFTANTTDAGSKPQYQWKVNGQDVQGATGKTWATTTLDNNGIVTCDIVSDYDCPQPLSATSNAITVPLQVSVGNISGIKEISLYPNPNRGSFTIKGKVNGAKVKVEVINAVGQVVYNREIPLKDGNLDEEINAGNMTDGIYLLRLTTGEERSSIRFRVAN